MTESSIRNAKLGCGAFALLFFGSIWGYFHFLQTRKVREMMGPPRAAVPADTPRVAEVRGLRVQNPEQALKLADEIVALPKSDDEKRSVLTLIPPLLQSVALRRLEAGETAQALALRERLEKSFPASDAAKWLRNEWVRTLAKAAMDKLRTGDAAAIATAYQDFWAGQPDDGYRYALDPWATYLLMPWQDGTGRPTAAGARHIAAASVVPETHRVERAAMLFVSDGVFASSLAELGDAQARTENRHAALALWQGAWFKLRNSGSWAGEKQLDAKRREALELQMRRKLAAGWTDLGDRLRRGERPTYVLVSAREAYEAAAKATIGLVEEMEILVKLLEFETSEIAKLAAPVLDVRFVALNGSGSLATEVSSMIASKSYDVRGKVRAVFESHGLRLWQCCLDTPGFDPWPQVPVGVREAIEPPGAGGAPAARLPEPERRKKLAEHYRRDPWHIPLGELEALRATWHQVQARWSLLTFAGNPEEAFGMMREVLREAADPRLREELSQTLRFRISRSGKEGDFNQFYLLAGFYVGEVGLPAAGDSFRTELRTGLQAAAENFKKGEKMKRIFILSLLAQCFPDEAAGRQARSDAFAAAFEAVSNVGAEAASAAMLPSPLAGHSVELINNSTDHHLLSFYRGAEMIAVHNWPWRRGTVVVPDGEYELVVLSPAASIRPYRGKAKLQRGVRVSDYVIKTTGQREDANRRTGSLASGDYRLLYAPAALGAMAVEPRTGLPRAKR